VGLRLILLDEDGNPVLDADGNFTFLEGDQVVEGTPVGVLATVDLPPTGSQLLITLSNGTQITIPVGQTTGFVPLTIRPDDVFIQGDELLNISIDDLSGGGFDTVTPGSPVAVTVVDDDDPTVVTLSDPTVSEGNAITITATVTNAPQTDLILTLSNGATITIVAGQTTGEVTFANPNGDDVYVDPQTLVYSITGTTGGNYEALDTSDVSTVSVVDTIDPTVVTLSDPTVSEGNAITITATVTNAPQTDLVLTLSNGATITIVAGQTTGAVTFANPNGEDVYVDPQTLVYSITGTTGGNYEALDTSDVSTVSVVDTIDSTVVTLSDPTVSEGNAITITATVTNAPQTDLILTLSNGATITIVAGQTTGAVTFANPNGEDVYVDPQTLVYSITGTTGGNYEALDTSDVSTVSVVDTIDDDGGDAELQQR
jgi:hypothetical protein